MLFFNDNDEDLIVENAPNETSLEKITIKGLFGRSDITLNFDKEVNIYIGENGLGKTTILNCVYYILHGEYEKLVNISFNEILVKFKEKLVIKFSKADVIKYVDSMNSKRSFRYSEIYSYIEDVFKQYNYDTANHYTDKRLHEVISSRLTRLYGMSNSQADYFIQSYISLYRKSNNGNEQNIIKLREILAQSLNERVIYLTTYRRIEKDYSEYFDSGEDRFNRMEEDALIRFGMKDVSKAINDILETIRVKTNQGFNKMTGVLLSKYANKPTSSSNQKKEINSNLLKIVLDRLGAQISEKDKKIILSLVSTNEIYNSGYQNLRDLIYELIRNYNQLKVYDEKIMRFKDTCNRYLNDKKFIYNQSDITLKILSEKSSNIIELSMLSSGEKQIVSLFSKLYLESDNKCILLIDEPELSISMQWQKMLLPDIMRSGNCKLLLTVTHSPFIFDNEFDNDAKDMWYCFRNSQKGEN